MLARTTLLNTTTNVFSHFRTKLANALLDLRFGAFLRGGQATRHPHLGAYAINNSSYRVVQTLFRGRVKPMDVLVDVGCGKGRVINAWLAEGYANRIIGVELDAEVAEKTRARLRRYPNVSVRTGDIITNFPLDGTLYYLFNPFDSQVMSRFKDRLTECISRRAIGEATLVYYNCRHVEVFAKDPACEIEYGRLEHPFAIIHVSAGRSESPSA